MTKLFQRNRLVNWRLGSWKFDLTMTLAKVQDQVGFNNVCWDMKRIPMWDFDGVAYADVISALHGQQLKWGLGPILILQSGSRDSYGAIAFDKFDRATCQRIVCGTDYLDWQYAQSFIRSGKVVRRLTDKDREELHLKTWFGQFRQPNNQHEYSLDHFLVIAGLFECSKEDLGLDLARFDNPPRDKLTVWFEKYETPKELE